MLKKTVGTIIIASALVASVGAIESEASTWNNSSLTQSQTKSGAWAKMFNYNSKSLTKSQTSLPSGNSGQSGTVTGSQVQVGKTSGEAAASQTQNGTIDVGESTKTYQKGEVPSAQAVGTKDPSYVFMGQRTSTAVFNFELSIKGGPVIQNTLAENYSDQSKVVIKK